MISFIRKCSPWVLGFVAFDLLPGCQNDLRPAHVNVGSKVTIENSMWPVCGHKKTMAELIWQKNISERMDPNLLARCAYPSPGELLTILKESDGLYKVEMINGTTGWTSSELWSRKSPSVKDLE